MTWHPDIERIRKAAECAPSIFNQRPWEVRLAADDRDRVELYAVPDPDPDLAPLLREVVISCGAALYNIRLAIRVAGHTPSVWTVPGIDRESLIKGLPAGRMLLASVEVLAGRPTPPTAGVEELYEALWLRRTDRWPYDVLPVPLPLLVEMEEAAARERGWLRMLHPREQKRLLSKVSSANDDSRMKQLRARPGLNKVPASAYGPESELVRPEFQLPATTARFERHPQLMTLSTDDDRPLDWLRAGQALQHALLTGTRYSMSAPAGRSARYRVSLDYHLSDWHPFRPLPHLDGYAVTASYLTQSLELDDLRDRPRHWPWQWFYSEVPQVVLRVGLAPVVRVPAPPPHSADSADTGAVWLGPSDERTA
jgi:hypothetical protein